MRYNQSLYNSNNYYNDIILADGKAQIVCNAVTISVGNIQSNCSANINVMATVTGNSNITIVCNTSVSVIGTNVLTTRFDIKPETLVFTKGKVLRINLSFQDYINALKSPTQEPIVILEFLDKNENVISSITPDLVDGTLSLVYQNGSRRSLDISLENSDGSYIPIPESSLWLDTRFKLSTGLKIADKNYVFNRGIFILSEPEARSNFSEVITTLNALDKWSLLDGTLGGTLTNDYIIPVDSNIENAVKSILTLVGDVKPPIIDPITINTPYTIVKEAGNTYADILIELANLLTYEIFYDENGQLRFVNPVDIENEPSVWDYNTDEVNYLGSARRFKYTDIYNTIVVIGDNINGSTVRAVAQDNNVNSPTRVSLIGQRTKVIRDELIYTNQLAQLRADYELKKAISLYESNEMRSIPIDIVNEGRVITISDESIGLNGNRYIVQSVNFPLRYNGEMSMSVWESRQLS